MIRRFSTCALLLFAVTAAAEERSFDGIVGRIERGTSSLSVDAALADPNGLCAARTDAAPFRYHAASISKLFTAIVVMQLRDERRLDLNDAIGRHVPQFAASPTTIEQLLTHTSGLRDKCRANGRTTRAQVDEYVRCTARQRLRGEPGKSWHYADANFNLLGRVIEQVTGKPYADVMRGRLLEPLKMTHSDFEIANIPADKRMPAYDKREKRGEHPWDRAFLPSSGLQTTAHDLGLFAAAVLRAADSDVDGLVTTETLKEMTTPRLPTDWGVLQGYGWQLLETELGWQWRHAGGEAGFESLLTIYPESGFGVALLGNREDWPRFELEKQLREGATSWCKTTRDR